MVSAACHLGAMLCAPLSSAFLRAKTLPESLATGFFLFNDRKSILHCINSLCCPLFIVLLEILKQNLRATWSSEQHCESCNFYGHSHTPQMQLSLQSLWAPCQAL